MEINRRTRKVNMFCGKFETEKYFVYLCSNHAEEFDFTLREND